MMTSGSRGGAAAAGVKKRSVMERDRDERGGA
jgi:hypothetical protein